MVANPFDTERSASLYAAGRPDYSDLASGIIRRLAGIEGRVQSAVDIGCGIGISAKALAPLAAHVVGIEPSKSMLDQAMPMSNVVYRIGSAEEIPLPDQSCDLIAVGSALHWFDQDGFLSEAARIGRDGAVLVVLDHWFTGRMDTNERFGEWMTKVYLATFPPPPRNRAWKPPSDLGDWLHTGWERYETVIPLSSDQFADYLLTQSNMQVAVARGDNDEGELRQWLVAETAQFFDEPVGSFVFG
ncbi:MAG: class I SAM-dependent methyltransferase, partial [bacterium]|nr:class I SAM-dependent methyltransferase [bacterium]